MSVQMSVSSTAACATNLHILVRLGPALSASEVSVHEPSGVSDCVVTALAFLMAENIRISILAKQRAQEQAELKRSVLQQIHQLLSTFGGKGLAVRLHSDGVEVHERPL